MPKKSMAGKRKREEAATSESPAKKPRKTQEKVSATELSDGTNHNAKLVKQLQQYADICRSKIKEDRVNVFRARGTQAAAEAIALMPVDLSTLDAKEIKKQLKGIKGVGKGTIQKVIDMVESEDGELEEVKKEKLENPEFAAQQLLRAIPSVGTKSADVLVANHVRTPAQVEEAAARGVDALKEMGMAPAQAKILSVTGRYAVDLAQKVPRKLQTAQLDFLRAMVKQHTDDAELYICGAYERGADTMSSEISVLLSAPGSEVTSTHSFGLKSGADNAARVALSALVSGLRSSDSGCTFEVARGGGDSTFCQGVLKVKDLKGLGEDQGAGAEAAAATAGGGSAASSSSSASSSSAAASASVGDQFQSLGSGAAGLAIDEESGRAVMDAIAIPDLDEAMEEAGDAAQRGVHKPAASGSGSGSGSKGPATPRDRAPESAAASDAEAAFEEARREKAEAKAAGADAVATGNVASLVSIHAVPSNHVGAAVFYHTAGQAFRETMQRTARKQGYALGALGLHVQIEEEEEDEDEDEEEEAASGAGGRKKAKGKAPRFEKDARPCRSSDEIFQALGVKQVPTHQWSLLQ